MGLAAAAIAAALLAAGPASAARPRLADEQTLGNDRFLIHWAGPPAPDMTPLARLALELLPSIQDRVETELGFPLRSVDATAGQLVRASRNPSLDPSGDPRYDVYIHDLGEDRGVEVTGRNPGSYFELDSELPQEYAPYVIAHEYFHTAQFMVDRWGSTGWLTEASANWAASRLTQPHTVFSNATEGVFGEQAWRRPEIGYAWDPFVEYLATTFGTGIVHELFETARGLIESGGRDLRGDPDYPQRIVDATLRRHSSSAADAFRGYAAKAAFPRYGYMADIDPGAYFDASGGWTLDVPAIARRPRTRHFVFELSPWTIRMINLRAGLARAGFRLEIRNAGSLVTDLQAAAGPGGAPRRIRPRACDGALCFVVGADGTASTTLRLVLASPGAEARRVDLSATPLRAGTRAKRRGSSATRRG
jgi:hypothetical protein